MQPLVSILMPCYNAEKYLNYAIKSILNQDYQNLEVLCVNDGSTDTTLEILIGYQKIDNRIVIINNERNIGLIQSLNNALKLVNGEYFARMDADDYSARNRISKQVDFMFLNPNTDLVSTAYNYFEIDNERKAYAPSIAQGKNSLKLLSLFCTPLTHASVLGKKSLITSNLYYYDENYPYAEDFELFSRLAWNNVNIANINEPLYWVRLHCNSVSRVYNDLQFQTNLKILKRNLKDFINTEDLTSVIFCLVACRINTIVTIDDIKKSFFVIDGIVSKLFLTLNNEELIEVDNYINLHKLNILIQVNIFRFKNLGFGNLIFLIQTVRFLNVKQVGLFFRKLLKN